MQNTILTFYINISFLFILYLNCIISQNLTSKGVIFFAYHKNESRCQKFLVDASHSAQQIKKIHPDLSITIFSNFILNQTQLKDYGFNQQVIIPTDTILTYDRQWWTRIMYLNHTPYEYTLSIDSDRVVCSDISDGFDILIHGDLKTKRKFDMLQVSGGILPAFDNGVIFYHKNPMFNELIAKWSTLQSKSIIGKFGDDQMCLASALKAFSASKNKTLSSYRVGILPPKWQVKHIPGEGFGWDVRTKYARTLVIHGDVKIAVKHCKGFIPIHYNSTRIYVSNQFNRTNAVVLSQKECNLFLNNRCDSVEIDWINYNYTVLDRREYLKRYHIYRKQDYCHE